MRCYFCLERIGKKQIVAHLCFNDSAFFNEDYQWLDNFYGVVERIGNGNICLPKGCEKVALAKFPKLKIFYSRNNKFSFTLFKAN